MNLFQKLRTFLHRRRLESDMAEEMRLHLEQRTREHIDRGLAPDQARYAALRRFGGVEQAKERCREQRVGAALDELARDFRFASRGLLKSPGFALIAVLTLALGIGLNTSMFSLANAVLLRPLPFAEADDLVRLYRATPGNARGGFSRPDYLDLKRTEAGLGRFAAYYHSSVSVSDPGRPAEWQNTLRVSADFFEILGVQPLLGRTFRADEENHGRHRVVVLGHALWQDRFGGAADIVGQTIRCDGEPYEVVGVLPASAHDQRIFGNARIFRPLGFTERERARRDIAFLNILGRRDPSRSSAEVEAFVAAFGLRLASAFPAENAKTAWQATGLLASTRKPALLLLVLMLLGLSGSVLAIACSNLANFLLARALARTRESAVRTALGASRLQLLRPLAVEASLLAALGGAGAFFVMQWATRWFNAQLVRSDDSPVAFAADWRVLTFAVAVSAITILCFGLAPALFTSRIDANTALKSSSHQATGTRRHRRFRHALIVVQFTLATVLVAGAGFFVRGIESLLTRAHGWDPEHVAQGYVQLPSNKYLGGPRAQDFQRLALERLEQLPGVKAASLSYGLPYRGLHVSRRYLAEGNETSDPAHERLVAANGISPSYFEVTGTRLLRGRAFNATDTKTSPRVAIISESMARTFFPGKNPLGQRVANAGERRREWVEIVGIVADVRSVNFTEETTACQLYEPIAQDDWHNGDGKLAEMFVAVRTHGLAPETMLESIRAAIMSVDADLPVRNLMPVSALLERAAAPIVLIQQLLLGFALLGLLLAALGLYGVIAHTVAQRTSEIGLRMALGARTNDIARLILRTGFRLAVVGALTGSLAGLGLSRAIGSMLPAMPTSPFLVLTAAALLLLAIALLACYLPARKASRIDPLVALRTE